MEIDSETCLALLAACLFICFVLKKWAYNRYLPPGPAGLPFFGYIPWLSDLRFDTFTYLGRKYKGVWSMYIGTQLNIYFDKYDTIKLAMADPKFSGRFSNKFNDMQTKQCGILFTEGEKWSLHRRLSLRALRDCGLAKQRSVELIREEIQHVFEDIDQAIRKKKHVNSMELYSIASNCIVSMLIFGSSKARDDVNMKETLHRFRTFLAENFLGAIPFLFPFTNHLMTFMKHLPALKRQLDIQEELVQCMAKYIEEREVIIQKGIQQAECVCDYFLLEKQKHEALGDFETFKEFQLIRVFLEFFFAGTDTTAGTLQFAMLYMAAYPKVQLRVQAELDKVIGERLPSTEDVTTLHYTNAVLHEVLRLSCVAPLAVAHRAIVDTEFLGYKIPSDAIINVNLHAVHTDPNLWKHPNDFNPHNFLDKKENYKASPYLIPFGTGMRACPGEGLAKMELFMLLASTLQRYRIKLADGYASKAAELIRGSYGIIRSAGYHQLVFCHRN